MKNEESKKKRKLSGDSRTSIIFKIILGILLLALYKLLLPIPNLKNGLYVTFLLAFLCVLPIPELYLYFNPEKEDYDFKGKVHITRVIIILVLVILYFIYAVGGMFKVIPGVKTRIYNLLEYETSESFETNFEEQKQDKVILLDEREAERVASSLMPNGGLYEFDSSGGTFNSVTKNGITNYYWNFPLAPKDPLTEGIFGFEEITAPGYIRVDATKLESADFIEKEMKYVLSESFSESLVRLLKNEKATKGDYFEEYSLEENDKGEAYWVVSRYRYEVGLANPKVQGVSIVDPSNGKVEHFETSEVPEWVDRVYPKFYFEKMLENWTKNDRPLFKRGTRKVSSMSYYIKNNKINLYAEITSSGDDQKLLGFMLFEPKTSKTTLFELNGKLSDRVYEDMDGIIENVQYHPEELRLVNIAGIPTYFSKVKAEQSIVGYTYGAIKQGKTAVAWGETIEEAKTKYINKYYQGSQEEVNSKLDLEKGQGIILRVGQLDENNFVFKLESDSKLYQVSTENFPTIALTQIGDYVKIEYLSNQNINIEKVKSFKNQTIK